jgi:ATP-dependent DNA helicase RecG
MELEINVEDLLSKRKIGTSMTDQIPFDCRANHKATFDDISPVLLEDHLRKPGSKIREKVIKVPNQMEAVRIFNYPYQAIEEAVVNAFYHRDYMSYEPVTIEIELDCINIMNFPGIDRSISERTIAEGKRFVSRYYRNRRLGEFLKELDLSEGHSSGIPTIQEELEKNGSPRSEFFTDEDRRAMRIRIPIHPAFIDEANFTQNERRLSEVLNY